MDKEGRNEGSVCVCQNGDTDLINVLQNTQLLLYKTLLVLD
jgi:hypothetical protein